MTEDSTGGAPDSGTHDGGTHDGGTHDRGTHDSGTHDVEEHIAVAAPAARIYDALCSVRRMARWSPECFGVWIYRRRDGVPSRFVGFNRRKGYVWFTTCHVVTAEPEREFTFDVTTLGLPVSRWGYRLAKAEGEGEGVTVVTEFWSDRRTPGALRLGRLFTGKVAQQRPQANRAGMRATLRRLKAELEAMP